MPLTLARHPLTYRLVDNPIYYMWASLDVEPLLEFLKIKEKKLDPYTMEYIFLGYSDKTKLMQKFDCEKSFYLEM